MKYKVDGWNNFCRVFQLPFDGEYPEGFLFQGGKPVHFLMVDWFNPVHELPQPAVDKDEWLEKVGPIKEIEITHDELAERLLGFVHQKNYRLAHRKYLIICDFGAAFVLNEGETHGQE